jgi:hypothetical protein
VLPPAPVLQLKLPRPWSFAALADPLAPAKAIVAIEEILEFTLRELFPGPARAGAIVVSF